MALYSVKRISLVIDIFSANLVLYLLRYYMEANIEEAFKAKEVAEKRFAERDFTGAKTYAWKAKTLYPELEGISQMVATFDVYSASEVKCNGEIDYYAILGLKTSASKEAVKKQYKKMAVLLHPDKNKTVGADGAFKLVSEAWTLLSNSSKRSTYDLKRTTHISSGFHQSNLSSVHSSGTAGFNNCSNLPTSHGRLDTFWTVCTTCRVQYEYLRKYVNKRLSCKNCRGTFVAVETGAAPVNGSFPYSSWSYVPGNGYGNHGYDGVTYVTTDASFFTGNGIPTSHSAHRYDYASNLPFQWSSFSGASDRTLLFDGPSPNSGDGFYQTNGNVCVSGAKDKARSNGKRHLKEPVTNINISSVAPSSYNEFCSKSGHPDKKRKVVGTTFSNGHEEKELKPASEALLTNGNANLEQSQKLSSATEISSRRNSCAPMFDGRKLLIEKARTEIRKKLEEIKLSSSTTVSVVMDDANPEVKVSQITESGHAPERTHHDLSCKLLQPNRIGPATINVPDPDFHDFDKDRSEECFKPKQIWAVYDEEDGMPRLYCLVREILSVKPFKIFITYLSSKTDAEFDSTKWLDSGFTKSCGNFRAYNSDVVDQVNIFSHFLSKAKASRGGCIRIHPKSGDIWAIYQNWSPDWDRSTPDEVRHQYEMVEVLDDYSEELGVCVTPLVKLAGFKTVYQRDTNKDAMRWISRREMLSFSHQVPSYLLKGEATSLPENCWDLDPAATPDELLHTGKGIKTANT